MDVTNPTTIKEYAQLMQEMDLSGLEISADGKTALRLERAPSAPIAAAPTPAAASAAAEVLPPVANSGVVDITSPMVGVFYATSAEDQQPFVSVGDKVSQGDVLCIIEAMKLMNEITCEYDGEIVEICAGNQQVVDYGQPLFRLQKETP